LFNTLLCYLRRQHAGLLALFIALSGTSYAVAANSITSHDIRNNTITGHDVKNGSLLGKELRNGSVESKDLRDGTVDTTDVRDAGITGTDIHHGTITGQHVRSDSLGASELATDSVSSDEIKQNAVGTGEVKNGTLQSEDFDGGILASNAVARFASFDVAVGATTAHSISCASGERALGGGVSFADDDGDDRMTFSEPRDGGVQPSTQGAIATAWRAAIYNGGATQRTANVWVMCATK
jgi:hypothetical protein